MKILSLVSLGLVVLASGCSSGAEEKKGADSAEAKGSASASAKPAKEAPAPIKLAGVKDDELKKRFEDAGYKDPFIVRHQNSEYGEIGIAVGPPAIDVRIFDFGSPQTDSRDFPALVDVSDKRVLVIASAKDFGTEAAMKSTMDLLKPSGCADVAACSKALKDAKYTEITPVGDRAQLGHLGYSLLNAKTGAAYVKVKIFDLRNEKAETVYRTAPPFVLAAGPEDKKPGATKADLQKALDVLR